MASKIYSVKYTNNTALPKARPAITVTAGKLKCVQIPFLTEGYITRLVIKQTGGTNVACTVDLFDSKVPYPVGEQNAGSAAADDVELYRIVAQQSVTSGVALIVIHEEYGFPFHNQDGTFTDNQRYIYLLLQPQAAGTDTTWEVALTGHNEVG